MILIAISAATIGIIENNDAFDTLRDFSGKLSTPLENLLILISRSLGASGWLIFIGIGVIVAEAIAISLAIINIQTLKLVLQIIVSVLFAIYVVILYIHNTGSYLFILYCYIKSLLLYIYNPFLFIIIYRKLYLAFWWHLAMVLLAFPVPHTQQPGGNLRKLAKALNLVAISSL